MQLYLFGFFSPSYNPTPPQSICSQLKLPSCHPKATSQFIFLATFDTCSFTITLSYNPSIFSVNLLTTLAPALILHSLPFYCTTLASSQSIFSQPPAPCSFTASFLTVQLKHLLNLSSHNPSSLLLHSLPSYCTTQASSQSTFSQHQLLAPS